MRLVFVWLFYFLISTTWLGNVVDLIFYSKLMLRSLFIYPFVASFLLSNTKCCFLDLTFCRELKLRAYFRSCLWLFLCWTYLKSRNRSDYEKAQFGLLACVCLFYLFLIESFCCDRKKRLAEMQEAAKVLRFGSVIPISGSDFVREVSQAPSDVWVVVILYKDGYDLILDFFDSIIYSFSGSCFLWWLFMCFWQDSWMWLVDAKHWRIGDKISCNKIC